MSCMRLNTFSHLPQLLKKNIKIVIIRKYSTSKLFTLVDIFSLSKPHHLYIIQILISHNYQLLTVTNEILFHFTFDKIFQQANANNGSILYYMLCVIRIVQIQIFNRYQKSLGHNSTPKFFCLTSSLGRWADGTGVLCCFTQDEIPIPMCMCKHSGKTQGKLCYKH